MPRTLALLHTSVVHVATFDRLLAELAPDVPVRHVVNESLLSEARQAGGITAGLASRIAATIQAEVEADAAVVLCTCSTIGGTAETIGLTSGAHVLRVDRPMAEQAVTIGARIIVAAALSSTLSPTRELILDVARKAGRNVDIIEVLCASAWARFEDGDQAGYLQEVATTLRSEISRGDVIVLAQASMAEAVSLMPDCTVPVLSSPRAGLEAAITAYGTEGLPS